MPGDNCEWKPAATTAQQSQGKQLLRPFRNADLGDSELWKSWLRGRVNQNGVLRKAVLDSSYGPRTVALQQWRLAYSPNSPILSFVCLFICLCRNCDQSPPWSIKSGFNEPNEWSEYCEAWAAADTVDNSVPTPDVP